MKYLLATCVISDYLKGVPGVVERVLSTVPDDMALSAVTRMEIEYGLQLNPSLARRIRQPLSLFFGTVHLIPFTVEDAIETADLRAELKRQGKMIGPYDLLLAGTALQRDLVFVTSDRSEFERIPRLRIEDWRERKGETV